MGPHLTHSLLLKRLHSILHFYHLLLYLLIVNSSVVPLSMCKSHFFSIVDVSCLKFCEQLLDILLILSAYCMPISICKNWFMTESLSMDSKSKSVMLLVACMRGLVVMCKLWLHFLQIVCKLICTHTISLWCHSVGLVSITCVFSTFHQQCHIK